MMGQLIIYIGDNPGRRLSQFGPRRHARRTLRTPRRVGFASLRTIESDLNSKRYGNRFTAKLTVVEEVYR